MAKPQFFSHDLKIAQTLIRYDESILLSRARFLVWLRCKFTKKTANNDTMSNL